MYSEKSDYVVENVSSQQLIVDFGLHYDGSKFAANKGYVKIETKMTKDMKAVVTRPHLLDDIESIQPPPQTLTGSLGHTEIERITPEFHFGLDAEAHNLRWNLAPGQTKAIEYDANGVKVKEWIYESKDGKCVWTEH